MLNHRFIDDPTILVQELSSAIHVYEDTRHIGYAVYQEWPRGGWIVALRIGSAPFAELEDTTYMPEDAVNLIIERYRQGQAERVQQLRGARLQW